jgi:hypothetical protein
MTIASRKYNLRLTLVTVLSGFLALFSNVAHSRTDAIATLSRTLVNTMPNANTYNQSKTITEVMPLMRVKSDLLEMIEKYGFLNQHQTHSSQGTLDPSYRLDRETEFYHTYDMESSFPSRILPKYGYINFKTSGEPARAFPADTAWMYGDLIMVFKPKVKSRMSYSLTDSLHPDAKVYPLSNLNPLEEFQTGKRHGNTYIEAQYLDELSLEDVSEIWLTEYVTSGTKSILKRISSQYKIPIFRAKPEKLENEHIQLSRQLDAKLTADPMGGTPKHFRLPTRDELVENYFKASQTERRIIVSLLAEQRIVEGLPSELENEVRGQILLARANLMKIAFGMQRLPVRVAALHALLSGSWPGSSLSKAEVGQIVEKCKNLEFLREVSKFYRTPRSFGEAFRKQVRGGSLNFDKELKTIQWHYRKLNSDRDIYPVNREQPDGSDISTQEIQTALNFARTTKDPWRASGAFQFILENLPIHKRTSFLVDHLDVLKNVDLREKDRARLISAAFVPGEKLTPLLDSVRSKLPPDQIEPWFEAVENWLVYRNPDSPGELFSILSDLLDSKQSVDHRVAARAFRNPSLNPLEKLSLYKKIALQDSEEIQTIAFGAFTHSLFYVGCTPKESDRCKELREQKRQILKELLAQNSSENLRKLIPSVLGSLSFSMSERLFWLGKLAKLEDDFIFEEAVEKVKASLVFDFSTSAELSSVFKYWMRPDKPKFYKTIVADSLGQLLPKLTCVHSLGVLDDLLASGGLEPKMEKESDYRQMLTYCSGTTEEVLSELKKRLKPGKSEWYGELAIVALSSRRFDLDHQVELLQSLIASGTDAQIQNAVDQFFDLNCSSQFLSERLLSGLKTLLKTGKNMALYKTIESNAFTSRKLGLEDRLKLLEEFAALGDPLMTQDAIESFLRGLRIDGVNGEGFVTALKPLVKSGASELHRKLVAGYLESHRLTIQDRNAMEAFLESIQPSKNGLADKGSETQQAVDMLEKFQESKDHDMNPLLYRHCSIN